MGRCFPAFPLLLLCLASVILVAIAQNYLPTDKILLDCGATSDVTDTDGQKWTADKGSKFLASSVNSSIAPAATQDPAVPQVPFMTARVFRSSFTYSFPLAAGRKFVRLYFYPASYGGLNASDALFSVTAASYTLLKNFSVAQTTEALNYAFIVKEYSINVDGGTLNITFSPSSNSLKAYAFVNGIEIVSMPDIYGSTDGTLMIVGNTSPFTIDNSTALENVYRLNVGGNDISPSGDTESADPNMTIESPVPPYIAPLDVYSTARSMGPSAKINVNYNLTWIFSVDSGFSYLVRLHFCEVASNITKINQRVFSIFLNNQTAEDQADVVAWANQHNGVPVHKDYVVLVSGGSPQQDLWLALHPNTDSVLKSMFYDAILNGVEIFKISSPDGNLAGPNPIPAPKQEVIDPSLVRPSSGSGHSKNQKAIIAGGVGGGVILALVIGCCVIAASRRHRQGKEASK
ncbi:hypothetical protein GH714_003775 [Hevea brasiliensis]|uniref:Malectin-like domain-containing protein n=1 Tax=Hevea brasiliensis TaxID=3981 RepID=A0A6A6KGI0_HEVBR|nr:hypothetical protein GH714_003775 [Hevea brasiliensis]